MMRVYVDESGDSGIKKGASQYFAIALVIVDEANVSALEECIQRTRMELGRSERFEFHFKDNSDNIREAFFRAVAVHPFRYFACVVDKSGYYSGGASSGQEFYRWVCEQVFEQAKPFLLEARVTLDEHSEREFRRTMEIRLKQTINSDNAEVKAIRSVGVADSRGSTLLQLADMVCGAVARSYRTNRDEPERFRRMIQHRENGVQLIS